MVALSKGLLALLVVGAGGASNPIELKAAELKTMMDAADHPIIVDVRPANEYEVEHLVGSLNVPWSDDAKDFVQRLPPETKTKAVAFYCNGPG